MRQPPWDKYEVALLIEAYWRIKEYTGPSVKTTSEKSFVNIGVLR